MNKEIEYHQKQYSDCVNEFLKENVDFTNDFSKKLHKACITKADGLPEYYSEYLDRASLNTKYFTKKIFDKLNFAYQTLGSHGYNSHQCKNL